MTRRLIHAALLIALTSACAHDAGVSEPVSTPPIDLQAAAAAHYEGYGRALADGNRSAIAGFYHPDGALIVFNGDPRRQSQAELHSRYAGAWTPPAWFTFDDLAFDSIAPARVLVTGGFRWHAAGTTDTTRFIYAAVLAASDSGMGIIFEHETLRP